MANKLVSIPIEVFGGLFGNAAKEIAKRKARNKEALDKVMKKRKKKK